MNIREIVTIILPGLVGSVNLSLNNQQLMSLIQTLLGKKATMIGYAMPRDGYLELRIKLPLVGEISINLTIESITISSELLIVKLKLMNVGSLLIKGVLAIIGKQGIECKMEDQYLILDLSDKWKDAINGLTREVKVKLDSVSLNVSFHSNKCIVNAELI